MSDSKEVTNTVSRKPPAAGKGRPKGALNKTTKAVKDALVEAFEDLGGVESLVDWAKENPTPFYQLWGKMLPQEIKGAGANGEHLISGGITVTFKRPDGNPVS